jgi:hypothetical protein
MFWHINQHNNWFLYLVLLLSNTWYIKEEINAGVQQMDIPDKDIAGDKLGQTHASSTQSSAQTKTRRSWG